MDNNSFWGNNPAILLNKNQIFELFPTSNMNYNQKLNSITRLIILLTFIGFIFSFSLNVLLAGLITIGIIYIYYCLKMKEGFSKNETNNLANTTSKKKIINPETLNNILG
jgi:predicted membrane protein